MLFINSSLILPCEYNSGKFLVKNGLEEEIVLFVQGLHSGCPCCYRLQYFDYNQHFDYTPGFRIQSKLKF